MTNYAVAALKPWNIAAFNKRKGGLKNWHLFTDKDALNPAALLKINPRYIFFPHWSWIVPDNILKSHECVCFHMTDVPFGRGGSPLQNLIERGHKDTKISALRMTAELDAGPIYMKKPLSLGGRAQDIFERAAEMVYDMIDEIVDKEPEAFPQQGEATVFKRREPYMSELPKTGSAEKIYDHIRMLDADTYPPAFVKHGDFFLTFKDAENKDGVVRAVVEIRKTS